MSASKKYATTVVTPALLSQLDVAKDVIERDALAAAIADILDRYLVKHVFEGALAMIRGQTVERALREKLEAEVATLVAAEVAKRADELETRVRRAVAERFDEVVVSEARRLMEEKLEEIRRRFA